MGFTAYALAEGKIPVTQELVRSVYSCTMCGACDTACKTNIGDNVEPLETLYELRAYLAKSGALPEEMLRYAVDERDGARTPSETQWTLFVRSLNLTEAETGHADTLLHFGERLLRDAGEWPTLRVAIDILRSAGASFCVKAATNIASGENAFDLGFQDIASEIAQRNRAALGSSGARNVVTFSAGAYSAFRNTYPRLGVSLEGLSVRHISDLLSDCLTSAQWDPIAPSGPIKVTYHDPCKLGRLGEAFEPWHGTWKTILNVVHIADPERKLQAGIGGSYDASRAVLRALPDIHLREMERSREYSYCCGAGAGAPALAPQFAAKTARDRLVEAESTGADVVVTGCVGCRNHLRSVAAQAQMKIAVKDLIEFVSERIRLAARPAAGVPVDAK